MVCNCSLFSEQFLNVSCTQQVFGGNYLTKFIYGFAFVFNIHIFVHLYSSEFHSGSRYGILEFCHILSPLLNFDYVHEVHSPLHTYHPSAVRK